MSCNRSVLNYERYLYDLIHNEAIDFGKTTQEMRNQIKRIDLNILKLQQANLSNDVGQIANKALVTQRKLLTNEIREIGQELAAQFALESIFSLDPVNTREAITELMRIGATSNHTKTELLLVTQNEADIGLIEVIKMRAKQCLNNKITLIVMPYDIFQSVMNAEPHQLLSGINKLSLLHHHATLLDEKELGLEGADYTDMIGVYVKRMPDLREILLRACCAAYPNDLPKKPYEVLLDKNMDLGPEDNELLFSQRKVGADIITLIRYKHPVTFEIKQETFATITNIGRGAKKIPLEVCQELNARLTDVPLLLPAKSLDENKHEKETLKLSKKDEQLKIRFFDRTQEMTADERMAVRDKNIRAQNFLTDQFNEKSIAGRVEKSLRDANCSDIKITAYVGSYYAGPDRVVPLVTHEQEKYPKSLTLQL